jgi:hypothetical protein
MLVIYCFYYNDYIKRTFLKVIGFIVDNLSALYCGGVDTDVQKAIITVL